MSKEEKRRKARVRRAAEQAKKEAMDIIKRFELEKEKYKHKERTSQMAVWKGPV